MEKLSLSDITLTQHNQHIGGGPFHYSASYNGSTGFGSDFKRELAIIKSIHELVERLHFKSAHQKLNTASTTGFAVHTSYNRAVEASICELVERDSVIATWLLKFPPLWLGNDEAQKYLDRRYQDLLKNMARFCLVVKFGVVAITDKYITACSILTDGSKNLRFGFIFSSATALSLSHAIASTLNELSRGAEVILSRIEQRVPLFNANLGSSEVANTSQHLEFYLNPKNMDSLDWFLNNSRPEPLKLPFYRAGVSIITNEFEVPWTTVVTFAHSHQYQKFFTGPPKAIDINFRRLSEISGSNIKDFNQGIHYLP